MLTGVSWVIVVFSIIFFFWTPEPQHYTVIVGILSSRENYRQRDIIRTSFNKHFTKHNVLLKFIVAKNSCSIPPSERVDWYECEPFTYDGAGEGYFLHDVNQVSGQVLKSFSMVGFDFDVQHDIVIADLGILDYITDGIKGNVKIMVYDRISEDPVLAIALLPFSQGRLIGNYRFKPVLNGNLSKGFKGSLVVEGLSNEDFVYFDKHCANVNGFGLIKVISGIRFGRKNGELPMNVFQSMCLLGPTFLFTAETMKPGNKTENYSNYSLFLHQEELSIQQELMQYDDLVIVDTVEFYRNLPLKMLKFYGWLSTKSFDFFLKSDDDCFINMTGILNMIEKISYFDNTNLWIGNFREFFGVHRDGKWAELEYRAVSYPAFACGSGYMLSYDIISWIDRNLDRLKTYQGEDTSLGIWLASIAPNRIQEDRFQCARTCQSEMFTLPQNNISQLEKLYYSLNSNVTCS